MLPHLSNILMLNDLYATELGKNTSLSPSLFGVNALGIKVEYIGLISSCLTTESVQP